MNGTLFKTFAVFLFIFSVMLFSQSVKAAYTATPAVDGLSGSTYKPLSMPNLTGSNFQATGKVLINGKLVNIPGYIPPASTAAQAAKTSLWFNPWLIGASLLAWADDAGLGSDVVNGTWTKTIPGDPYAPGSATCTIAAVGKSGTGETQSAACHNAILKLRQCPPAPYYSPCYRTGSLNGTQYTFHQDAYCWSPSCTGGFVFGDFTGTSSPTVSVSATGPTGDPQGTTEPATQADFDALPDPVPEVYRELAPQVGVPVDSPIYNPVTVEIGDPYTKPDGSTAQPMAQVSPASNGQVTIDTFDQPLTDPQGNPTPTAPPVDTPEEQPQGPTDCEKFPTSVGCTDLGTPTAGELMPHSEVPLSFNPVSLPGNATCPAPITVGGFGSSYTIEYDAACSYASGIRPVAIAVAYITALFIIFGVPRSASS